MPSTLSKVVGFLSLAISSTPAVQRDAWPRGLGQMFDVIVGVVIGARPIRWGGVSQSSRFVAVDVKLVAPEEAGNAGPGEGPQSEQPRKERQGQSRGMEGRR